MTGAGVDRPNNAAREPRFDIGRPRHRWSLWARENPAAGPHAYKTKRNHPCNSNRSIAGKARNPPRSGPHVVRRRRIIRVDQQVEIRYDHGFL
jgi:hypothetical protein